MSKQDMSKNLTSINSLCSVLEFSGEGVISFLNNLLVSDLPKLNQNQLYYSALCNPKGRIISSVFLCINNKTNALLFCPQNMASNLLQFFTMRKFRLKFSIALVDALQPPNNSLAKILTAQTFDGFYLALFDKNLPWIDANNTEKHIPQHVNLDQHDDIMSFTKGCYPGQEIIARLKYLGKIKKRMVTVSNKSKAELTKEKTLISPIIKIENSHYIAQKIGASDCVPI